MVNSFPKDQIYVLEGFSKDSTKSKIKWTQKDKNTAIAFQQPNQLLHTRSKTVRAVFAILAKSAIFGFLTKTEFWAPNLNLNRLQLLQPLLESRNRPLGLHFKESIQRRNNPGEIIRPL